MASVISGAVLLAGVLALVLWLRHVGAQDDQLVAVLNSTPASGIMIKYPTSEAFVITRDGAQFLEIKLPHTAGRSFPSGSPVVIFDAGGKLVDWTIDIGDNPTFSEKWHSGAVRTPIDLSELPSPNGNLCLHPEGFTAYSLKLLAPAEAQASPSELAIGTIRMLSLNGANDGDPVVWSISRVKSESSENFCIYAPFDGDGVGILRCSAGSWSLELQPSLIDRNVIIELGPSRSVPMSATWRFESDAGVECTGMASIELASQPAGR